MLLCVGIVMGVGGGGQKGFNTKWPTLVFCLAPTKPLQLYGYASPDRRYSVCSVHREMTSRSQTLSWWLEGGGVKTTEKNVLANTVGIGHVCIMRKYVIRLLITQSKPAPLSQILSYTHLPLHCLRFFS
jgi:hypothetical protein